MELKLRPIRRQCFVPGCRNLDCFVPMRSREMPVTIVLCSECIKAMYDGVYPAQTEEAVVETEAEPEEAETPKPRATRKKA